MKENLRVHGDSLRYERANFGVQQYKTRAYQQKAMEQIEETQVAFKEDLNQVSGDVTSMKRDLSQVLLALKSIIDRQDHIPRVAFKEVTQTIGASRGHQPRKEPEAGLQKSTMDQQETRQADTEGIVPPPPKLGASHTL